VREFQQHEEKQRRYKEKEKTPIQNVIRETIRNFWMKTGVLPYGFLDKYLAINSDSVADQQYYIYLSAKNKVK